MRWGIGAAAGGRLWLALGVESHRVYCSSASAFGWVDRGVVVDRGAGTRARVRGGSATSGAMGEEARAGSSAAAEEIATSGSEEETKVAQWGFHLVS